jgi:hypothetical protein
VAVAVPVFVVLLARTRRPANLTKASRREAGTSI